MRSLEKKLIRDSWRLRWQVVTIAIVFGCGVASYTTVRSTYRSLQRSKEDYYGRFRFGDAFATLKRAPNYVLERVADIPGVSQVMGRVVQSVQIPVENMLEPATGKVISIPDKGVSQLNAVHVRQGTLPTKGAGQVLVLEKFAKEHKLVVGSTLDVVLEGVKQRLVISGVASSPEFLYAIAPGEIMPDDKKFAVLWMPRSDLTGLSNMTGAFNDVVLGLRKGADGDLVVRRLDKLLQPYGSYGALLRDNQTSNYYLQQELEQLRGMSTVVPVIFLAVAAFLINLVLSRLVQTQRSQIATLRAVGYYGRQLAGHYLLFAALVVLLGSIFGVALGWWLGFEFTALYGNFFKFPLLVYSPGADIILTAILLSSVAAVGGVLAAAIRIAKMPPAQAMQPPAPARYQTGFFDVFGSPVLFGQSGRMIVRELVRKPMRTILSASGISMAIAILIAGRFSYDAINYLMDVYFPIQQRQDVLVAFRNNVSNTDLDSLRAIGGVNYVEGVRTASVRLHNKQYSRQVGMQINGDDDLLRPIVEWPIQLRPTPLSGVLLSRKLAEILHVSVGQDVRMELLEADRRSVEMHVEGIVNDLMGLQAYCSAEYWQAKTDQPATINAANLMIDPKSYSEITGRIKEIPLIMSITTTESILRRFREQSGYMMIVFTVILAAFASAIAVGVVYNNARISMAQKARDFATLRVLGFWKREVSALLLGELAAQLIVGIVPGILLGRWLSTLIASTVDPEQFRLPVLISANTYLFALAVVFFSAAFSGALVRRRVNRLDLISVLKTRE